MTDLTLPEVLAEMRRIAGDGRLASPAKLQRWVAALEKYRPLVAAGERYCWARQAWSEHDGTSEEMARLHLALRQAALALFAKDTG